MQRADYVVIGGGIAGVSCVQEILSNDDESVIILFISAGPILKTVLSAEPITQRLARITLNEVQGADHFGDSRVKFATGVVTKIDSEKRLVHYDEDARVNYDKLILCTGASPLKIHECALTIRDTESVVQLEQKIGNARKVVIVGNGGIAAETVYGIRMVDIVWVVKDDHICGQFLDQDAAIFATKHLEDSPSDDHPTPAAHSYATPGSRSVVAVASGASMGPNWQSGIYLQSGSGVKKKSVFVEFCTEVAEIRVKSDDPSHTWPYEVILKNGKAHDCDVIISAIGVKPNVNIELMGKESFALGTDGGIVVNGHMKTNIDGIYAAGDVCSMPSQSEDWVQMRLWSQAMHMGQHAAKCAIADFRGMPPPDGNFELFTHVTSFFGCKVVILGDYFGKNNSAERKYMVKWGGRTFVKLATSTDFHLKAALLMGDTNLEETCENLILSRLDLSTLGDDFLHAGVDLEDFFD